MSLTLSDAITEVRDLLNESTAAYWSDAQITKWIQEGTRIFSSKTLMVEETGTISPLFTTKISYTGSVTANMIEPYAVLYTTGVTAYKGLIKIHPRQIGNLATGTAGPPKYYCFHDRRLYIFPQADATVASDGSLLVLYSKETDDITDVTDEYQHLPIIYACAKAKQKDQKFGEASVLLSQFFQEISFERTDKHAREVDSLDKFKIPGRGGGAESAGG